MVLTVLKPKLETRFDGLADWVAYFIEAVTVFLNGWGNLFEDDAQRIEYIASRLDSLTTESFVSLHEIDAPELRSVRCFVRALRAQFDDPTVVNEA